MCTLKAWAKLFIYKSFYLQAIPSLTPPRQISCFCEHLIKVIISFLSWPPSQWWYALWHFAPETISVGKTFLSLKISPISLPFSLTNPLIDLWCVIVHCALSYSAKNEAFLMMKVIIIEPFSYVFQNDEKILLLPQN